MADGFGWLKGGRGWLCIWALLLISCMPDSVQNNTNVPECTLTPPGSNIYQEDPSTIAQFIFNNATTPGPPQVEQYDTARFNALQDLAYQIWRWSDSADFHLSDNNMLRITVTFISPELAETVALNQILLIHNTFQDFHTQKMNRLNSIAMRNELVFLVTVTATRYDALQPITMNIPAGQMNLTNAANAIFPPHHNDHSLDEFIQLEHGPETGYLAYQMSNVAGGACGLTLDQSWNNSITIDIPNLEIDNIEYGAQSWTIKYKPLLDFGMSSFGPVDYLSLPNGYDTSLLSPSSSAPPPFANMPDFNQGYKDPYWTDMARYIWGEITLDNPK